MACIPKVSQAGSTAIRPISADKPLHTMRGWTNPLANGSLCELWSAHRNG
jgi:hypothetical protein